jgi:hypothetical protein
VAKKRKITTTDVFMLVLVAGALLGSQLLPELPAESGIRGAGYFEKQGHIKNDWPCRKSIDASPEENDLRCESGICSIQTKKCQAPGQVWDICQRDTECGLGLECEGNSCVLKQGQECSATSANDQCSAKKGTPRCMAKYDGEDTTCAIVDFSADLGETCGVVIHDVVIDCVHYLTCKEKNGRSTCDYT